MALTMIKPLGLEQFTNQKKFLVLAQNESYAYEEGKRGAQDGYKVTVFEDKQREKLVIKVKGQINPPFADADIAAEKVYAEFENVVVKSYLSNGFINYSFSADSVKAVTEPKIINRTQE